VLQYGTLKKEFKLTHILAMMIKYGRWMHNQIEW